MNRDIEQEARTTFEGWLCHNSYPGRGIVVGLDESGNYLVQVYWIMGRSENSRNRVFKCTNEGRLYTAAADPKKMKDPSLVIYNAMLEVGPHYIVSNGDQTDTVAKNIGELLYLQPSLDGRLYEPDAPNFTQRITAVSSLRMNGPVVQMSILRKSRFGDGCDEATYLYRQLKPGLGFFVTTYDRDGTPLPPYRGEPELLPLCGPANDVLQAYWNALDEENRVSLAVKFIEVATARSSTCIINKYEEI